MAIKLKTRHFINVEVSPFDADRLDKWAEDNNGRRSGNAAISLRRKNEPKMRMRYAFTSPKEARKFREGIPTNFKATAQVV